MKTISRRTLLSLPLAAPPATLITGEAGAATGK